MPITKPPSTGHWSGSSHTHSVLEQAVAKAKKAAKPVPTFNTDPYASPWDGVGPSLLDPSGNKGAGVWRDGFLTGTTPVYVYQASKSANPPPLTAFASDTYPQGCVAMVPYQNTDGQGNIEAGNAMLRAPLIPVSPLNTWQVARTTEAKWEPGGAGAAGQWFAGPENWAGRWVLPARCGDWNDATTPHSVQFKQLNKIAQKKLEGVMDMPTSPVGSSSTDWFPCPDRSGQAVEAGHAFMSSGAGPAGDTCRGRWWQSPDASEIVYLGLTPKAEPPPAPCPGDVCEFHVYDRNGFGYTAFSFRQDGSIIQRFQKVRSGKALSLWKDYSYMDQFLPEGSVSADGSLVSQAAGWIPDPQDPTKKIWVQGGGAPGASANQSGVQATNSAPADAQSGYNYSEKNPCGPFRQAGPDGECKVRWGAIAALAASIWLLG